MDLEAKGANKLDDLHAEVLELCLPSRSRHIADSAARVLENVYHCETWLIKQYSILSCVILYRSEFLQ